MLYRFNHFHLSGPTQQFVRAICKEVVKEMDQFKYKVCLYFLILAFCSANSTSVNDLSKGITEFAKDFYLVSKCVASNLLNYYFNQTYFFLFISRNA